MDNGQAGEATSIRPMAVAVSKRPLIFDPCALAAAIRSRHPGVAVEAIGNPHPAPALLIRCGEELVALLGMPGPALP